MLELDALLLHLKSVLPEEWFYRVYDARMKLTSGNGISVDRDFFLHERHLFKEFDWLLESVVDSQFNLGHSPCLNRYDKKVIRQTSLKNPSTETYIDQEIVYRFVVECFGSEYSALDGTYRREYPSAGGAYSVQIFCAIRNEFDSWHIKHYLPLNNQFENICELSRADLSKILAKTGEFEPLEAKFMLFYGIIPAISIAKYGPRGYKFAMLEIGAMLQVALTFGEKFGFRSRPYAAIDELSFASVLGFEPEHLWFELVQVFD